MRIDNAKRNNETHYDTRKLSRDYDQSGIYADDRVGGFRASRIRLELMFAVAGGRPMRRPRSVAVSETPLPAAY